MSQQEDPEDMHDEENLERMADSEEMDMEDDALLQMLQDFRKRPLNLNYASIEQLRRLPFLTELHLQYFLRYREEMGLLLDRFELQAIPGWYPELIRKILPFVIVSIDPDFADLKKRFEAGQQTVLFRISRNLEKASAFKADSNITDPYFGNPDRIMIRYTRRQGKQLQYGFVADKDPGEAIRFTNGQRGFDFYSYHIFLRGLGKINALALGDFTVQMGQGLIHWQGMAFSKSSMVTAIKRQGEMIRPYHSAGEYNFHRGIALTAGHRDLQAGFFVSRRNFDGNLSRDSVSSILSSGLHRNRAEWQDRHILPMTTIGGKLGWYRPKGSLSINTVHYFAAKALTKKDIPYNLFAIRDDRWQNISIDYTYTVKNMHLFGEFALDKRFSMAAVHGCLISLHDRFDLTFLYRNISAGFQSLFSNAFTEQSRPTNEEGFFQGLSFRLLRNLQLDAYADIFRFPWLKFGVDFPSKGSETLVGLTYKPSRGTELILRWKTKSRQENASGQEAEYAIPIITTNSAFRTQLSLKINNLIQMKYRIEFTGYQAEGFPSDRGFLCFLDMNFSPVKLPVKGNFRVQYFETGSYNSRIYAYEADLPFSNSIPGFYDQGFRYYINLRYTVGRSVSQIFGGDGKISLAAKFEQSIFPEERTTGSGIHKVSSSRRSAIKVQLLANF